MGNLIPLDRAVGIDDQRKYMAQMEDKGNFSPESITMATKIINTGPGKKDYISRGLVGYPVDKEFYAGDYGSTFGMSETQQVYPELKNTMVYKSVPAGMMPPNAYGSYDSASNSIKTSAAEELRGDSRRLLRTANHETQHAVDAKDIRKNTYTTASAGMPYDYDTDVFERRATAAGAMFPGRFGKMSAQQERNVDTAGMLGVYKNGELAKNIDSVSDNYFYSAWPVAQQILQRNKAERK